MNSVGGAVQEIMLRFLCLPGLDVHFRLDPGDIRLSRVIGGDRGEVLAVREDIEGSPGQGHAGTGVLFHDDDPNFPDILEGEHHIVLAGPLDGFHPGVLHIARRGGLLSDPVGAVGQGLALEGNLSIEPGDAGGLVVPVNLLKTEHRAL